MLIGKCQGLGPGIPPTRDKPNGTACPITHPGACAPGLVRIIHALHWLGLSVPLHSKGTAPGISACYLGHGVGRPSLPPYEEHGMREEVAVNPVSRCSHLDNPRAGLGLGKKAPGLVQVLTG